MVKYLYERSRETWAEDDLSDRDINWIMEMEGNETNLLAWRYDNDVGGKQSPASGGLWYVKRGNIVVLAELMWWAATFHLENLGLGGGLLRCHLCDPELLFEQPSLSLGLLQLGLQLVGRQIAIRNIEAPQPLAGRPYRREQSGGTDRHFQSSCWY